MIYTALDTFYVSPQQIADSPSRKDGVDEPTESLLRRFGCELIQESGILLKMPQAVMATGQVLFHRFYCKKSFSRFNVKRVAASCVWLASKLEESPRRMTDILNVFYRIDCRRENREIDFPDHKKYEEMKVDLIRTERHLLKEMGFICHVEHPHKFILNYLLQLEAPPELMQEAWNLANDSLRTTLCVRFKSEVVACGVVYAAARRFRVPLPENPPWWQVFDAEKSDVEEVCRVLSDLYRQPKAHYAEVRKDAKSFVLTSTAWDPPPDAQVNLLKVVGNGGATAMQPPSASPDARPPSTNSTGDRSKIAVAKDSRTDFQELQTSSGNGELRDDQSVGKTKLPNDKEDGGSDNSRLKDRNRQLTENEKDRDRDRERDNRDRTRERDRDREKDREKEREREKLRERVHRSKDRRRDPGHADKLRHRPSSRDHEFQNSHALIREKERHRYHPYV